MSDHELVLLVTNIITPYRIPLFNEIADALSAKGIGFKVVFGAHGYSRRKWKMDRSEIRFDYTVLESGAIVLGDSERTTFTYRGLLRLVRRERPSVVITNAFSAATMKLWARSFWRSTPYIIWSGAVKGDIPEGAFLRNIQRRLLVGRASGFIAYGTKAKEYLVSLGADGGGISIGINTVDTDYFAERTRHLRAEQTNDDKKRILHVGYLSKRKKVDQLLRIVKKLSSRRSDFILQLVGDGDEYDDLRGMVIDLDITDYVTFEGYKQKHELPGYLAMAQCFLFPTGFDIWGLVLVEAMAAGLPCISSVNAGAAIDLIEDGVNGFAMDFSDEDAVVEKICWLFDNPEKACEMGRRAALLVNEKVSIKKSASGFIDAALKALNAADGP